MLRFNRAVANVSWPLNNSISHCIAGKLRSDFWQCWSLMRGNSVILVIGKEENQTLPMLLTLRQLICPLPFPLLWPTSQWPLTIINWVKLMLLTGMCKKKVNKRPLIYYLPTQGHDTQEGRAGEKRKERSSRCEAAYSRQTSSGISTDALWSPLVRYPLEAIEQSRSGDSSPPDRPVTASSFNPTPPFSCMLSLGVQMKKHRDYNSDIIAKLNYSILFLPLTQFLYESLRATGYLEPVRVIA